MWCQLGLLKRNDTIRRWYENGQDDSYQKIRGAGYTLANVEMLFDSWVKPDIVNGPFKLLSDYDRDLIEYAFCNKIPRPDGCSTKGFGRLLQGFIDKVIEPNDSLNELVFFAEYITDVNNVCRFN